MAERRQQIPLEPVDSLTVTTLVDNVVFDVLDLGGVPLTELPLRNRRKRLEDFLPGLHPCLQLVAQTRDLALAQQWLALLPALEGVGQRNRMVTTHRGAETG